MGAMHRGVLLTRPTICHRPRSRGLPENVICEKGSSGHLQGSFVGAWGTLFYL